MVEPQAFPMPSLSRSALPTLDLTDFQILFSGDLESRVLGNKNHDLFDVDGRMIKTRTTKSLASFH